MKCRIVALTTLLATMALTVPVTAQIQNPSQEFFEQGREQLEREIEILQQEPLDFEQNLEDSPVEPELEVPPSPTSDSSQKPNEVETPSEKPNEVKDNDS